MSTDPRLLAELFTEVLALANAVALKVAIVDGSGDQITSFGGAGGTASNFGAAFPTPGTAVGFKDNAGTAMEPGNLDAAGSLKVAIISGGGSGTPPGTATLSNVASNAASVTVLASNANRIGAVFYNDADKIVRLKFGITASATSFTRLMMPGENYELPRAAYTGRIDGIWDAAPTGSMRVTELTA